jgi:hypothetical protein
MGEEYSQNSIKETAIKVGYFVESWPGFTAGVVNKN